MLYSSIDNKKIKDIKKLHKKKYRDLTDMFLVEGEHLVEEAYKRGNLESIIIEDGTSCSIDKNNIYVTSKVMNYISELDNPPKIIGLCHKLREKPFGKHILILDDIQDPGNLGTIVRSAIAFNFDTIILSKKTVDLYSSKVIRASQGLLFSSNAVVRELKDVIPKLKEDGYQIIGTRVDNGIDVRDILSQEKIALVMGNEGQGVSEEILTLCDSFVHIKMNRKCESLNVGVATSIMLYELSK